MCSFFLDQIGHLAHLNARNTTFVGGFGRTVEEPAEPAEQPFDLHGPSCVLRDGDDLYHTGTPHSASRRRTHWISLNLALETDGRYIRTTSFLPPSTTSRPGAVDTGSYDRHRMWSTDAAAATVR